MISHNTSVSICARLSVDCQRLDILLAVTPTWSFHEGIRDEHEMVVSVFVSV